MPGFVISFLHVSRFLLVAAWGLLMVSLTSFCMFSMMTEKKLFKCE